MPHLLKIWDLNKEPEAWEVVANKSSQDVDRRVWRYKKTTEDFEE